MLGEGHPFDQNPNAPIVSLFSASGIMVQPVHLKRRPLPIGGPSKAFIKRILARNQRGLWALLVSRHRLATHQAQIYCLSLEVRCSRFKVTTVVGSRLEVGVKNRSRFDVGRLKTCVLAIPLYGLPQPFFERSSSSKSEPLLRL